MSPTIIASLWILSPIMSPVACQDQPLATLTAAYPDHVQHWIDDACPLVQLVRDGCRFEDTLFETVEACLLAAQADGHDIVRVTARGDAQVGLILEAIGAARSTGVTLLNLANGRLVLDGFGR